MHNTESIRDKISKNKIKEAISDLIRLSDEIEDKELINLILLKNAEFEQLRKDELIGDKKDEDIQRRRLRICLSLLEINIELTNKLNESSKTIKEVFITEEREANQSFDIREILKKSERFHIVGYSFTGVLDMFQSTFIEAIQKGTTIKIIVISPEKNENSAANLLSSHQLTHDIKYDAEKTLKIINRIRKEAGELVDSDSQLKIRFTSWIPSCSLQISNPNSSNAILRMGIYPLWVPTNHREIRTFKIIEKNKSPIVFDYLSKQFDSLWNDSTKEEELKI